MIPELIISGEDAKGEFLMSVPRKMLLCSFCVMTMKQERQIRRLRNLLLQSHSPFKIKL